MYAEFMIACKREIVFISNESCLQIRKCRSGAAAETVVYVHIYNDFNCKPRPTFFIYKHDSLLISYTLITRTYISGYTKIFTFAVGCGCWIDWKRERERERERTVSIFQWFDLGLKELSMSVLIDCTILISGQNTGKVISVKPTSNNIVNIGQVVHRSAKQGVVICTRLSYGHSA